MEPRTRKRPDIRLAFSNFLPPCQYIRGHRRPKALGSAKLACGHFARLVVSLEFEAEFLAFDDRVQPCTLDSRDVNEHISTAVVGLDEAEAFGGIEPFNCASGHEEPFLSNIDHRRATHSGFSTFEREVRQEARGAAKTNIGKQSIDVFSVQHFGEGVNFLFWISPNYYLRWL
ncbi:hypothetical protein ABIA22_006104 [Sinorhizobium fredii]